MNLLNNPLFQELPMINFESNVKTAELLNIVKAKF